MGHSNISGVSGDKGKGSVDPALANALAARRDVFSELKLDPDTLGPNARTASEGILEDFKGRTTFPEGVLKNAAALIQDAHAQDVAAVYDPGTPPDASKVSTWAKTTQIKEDGGRLKLIGAAAGEGHPVGKLLSDLGIDPNNLSPNVADNLAFAISKQVDLSRPKNWNFFARELLRGKMLDGGRVTTAKAAEVKKTDGPIPKTPLDDSTGVTSNPGLEKVAPTQVNTGSKAGAMHALMGNLASNKAQDKDVDAAAEELADLVRAQAQFDDLSMAERRTINTTLRSVLKDRGSVDGNIRSTAVALNAYEQLAAIEEAEGIPGQADSHAFLANFLHQLVKSHDGPVPEPVQNLCNNIATMAVTDLAAAKLGKPIDRPNEEIFGAMNSAIGKLNGSGDDTTPTFDHTNIDRGALEEEIKAKFGDGAGETSKADKTETKGKTDDVAGTDETAKGDKADKTEKTEGPKAKEISAEAKQLAKEAMESLGIEPNNPDAANIKAAYEQIFNGGSDPKDVALNTARYFDGVLGTKHAQQAEQLLANNPEPTMLEEWCNKSLAQVAACAADPEGFKARAAQAANAAGNANAGQMLGVPAGFGTGGIMGPGSPMDADGAKNPIYLQRTMVISSILNDPSLSIEDKIFYFMMWFAAFADKEREQKMREIADLDRVNQQNDMKKKDIHRERGAMYSTRKELQSGVDAAESKLNKLTPNANEIKRIETKLAQLESKGPAKPEEIQAAKAEVTKLTDEGVEGEALQGAIDKLEGLQTRGKADPEKVSAAQTKYDEAVAGGDDKAIKAAKKNLDKATRGDAPHPGQIDGLKKELAGLQKASKGTPEEIDKAKADLTATQRKLAQANGRIDQLSEQFDKLKNETDQAPKSRELLFMELERIQRFRGMLIDMANSFMRDMARRVKEIMQ